MLVVIFFKLSKKGEDLSYQLWIIQPIVIEIMALPLPLIPASIVGLPLGNYGISYDISLRRTEDDLPNGWHSHQCKSSFDLMSAIQ